MKIVTTKSVLREAMAEVRLTHQRIGFVPTMGALHAGHIALVEAAKAECDVVVASIFVNPTQFGVGEDLARYPRPFEQDRLTLEAAGVALLYHPSAEDMYPEQSLTQVTMPSASERLCGALRPGHFDGVGLVVSKLLNRVQPDAAYFGEKDYQQLQIVKRIVDDLDMPVEVIGVPTVREKGGLALSSRNQYLSDEERVIASQLNTTLNETAETLCAGENVEPTLNAAKQALIEAGFASVDYLELCDADTLKPLSTYQSPARLLVAARLGTTRLIDNVEV